MKRPGPIQNPKNSSLNHAQVLAEIKQQQFRPVYLFYGTERYLMEELALALREALVKPEAAGLDYDLLDGGSITPARVVNCANTPPWLLDKRLVLVKDVPWFRETKKGKAPASTPARSGTGSTEEEETANEPAALAADLFIGYLKKPNPDSVVVLLAPGEADRRRRLFKQVAAAGSAVECREMNDRDRRAWLKRQGSGMGIDLEPAALDYLIAFGGKSLHGLVNELTKLSLFLNQTPAKVTLAVVQELCPRNVEERLFDIMQAVSEKRTDLALSRIRELTQKGIQPPRIFYLLVRHLRRLLQAKSAGNLAYPDAGLARSLKVDAWLAQRYWREAKNFSETGLAQALKWMLELDIALKTSLGDPEIWLEVLIARLALPPEPGMNLGTRV